MKTVTLSEAQADFAGIIAANRNESVEIIQNGERIGVFIPDGDAELIEELLLAQKAANARAEGFIGTAASQAFLDRFRNAED